MLDGKIIDFENRMMENVKQELSNIKNEFSNYNFVSPLIYTIVLDKENEYEDNMFTKMIEETSFDIYSTYLDSVYIDLSYDKLDEIKDKVYVAKLIFKDEVIKFEYELEYDTRYDEKIKELYESFLLSNMYWFPIDKREILKMHRIKVIRFLDDIQILENIDFSNLKIDYGLLDNAYFNKTIYYNCFLKKQISKMEVTRFNEIAFAYRLKKDQNCTYVLKDDERNIFDVCMSKDDLVIYSNKSNLFTFEFYEIKELNEKYLKKFTKNYNLHQINFNTRKEIKDFLLSYQINLKEIYFSNENIEHIKIPKYNPNLIKTINLFLYLNIEYKNIYDLFQAINILDYYIPYEVRVYEK